MPARFINVDRDTPFLMPPDLRDWVDADDSVHFVIEAVNALPDSIFHTNARGSGSKQYPPKMMMALLAYCYSRRIVSSRRIEEATHHHVAVRLITGNHHPDHDTIAAFRRNNGVAFKEGFVQVLLLAEQIGMLHVGTISVDGTLIKANASKDQNVRYDRSMELIAQPRSRRRAADPGGRSRRPEARTRRPPAPGLEEAAEAAREDSSRQGSARRASPRASPSRSPGTREEAA